MVSAALGRSRKENVDGREIDKFVELEAKKTSGLRGSQGESVSSSREWPFRVRVLRIRANGLRILANV